MGAHRQSCNLLIVINVLSAGFNNRSRAFFPPETFMRYFRILSCFCTSLFFFVLLLSNQSFAQSNLAIPRFEKSECAIWIPTGEKVECGYLVVRENRTIKNSPTIRLPVIIMKSENPNPLPDPILRTLGGPGVTSLKLVGGRRSSPWLKNRDMIIFEQRGTKYSQPALECPEVNGANIDSAKQKLGESEKRRREVEAAKVCRARLVKAGIDLEAYNSVESAGDIEDLRQALKLEKINLYGVSYSARLMLNAMRDYPQGIRSVVIESTMPLEINYDEVGVDGIKRTLDLLSSKCAADAECAKNFPNLEKEFYAFVKKANAAPVLIDVKESSTNEIIKVQLTGNDIITWAIDYLLSSDAELIVSAPLQMNLVSNGNFKPLQNYANDKLSPSSNSLGMRYSVWCREEMPFQNPGKIAKQSTKYADLKSYVVQNLPSICSVWNIPKANAIENEPVKSDIPTLIIAGEYDAYTPPDWGRQTAKNLKNSYFIELPWLAHGAGFSAPQCVREMISEFFDTQKFSENAACLESIRNKYKFMGKINAETRTLK
jgi:pimeloyl-ACP methyl ester carboxylesterase